MPTRYRLFAIQNLALTPVSFGPNAGVCRNVVVGRAAGSYAPGLADVGLAWAGLRTSLGLPGRCVSAACAN